MKATLTFVFILLAFELLSQNQNIDNYSFFKLYVTNDKAEVLLVKWEGQWEIVGNRYNESLSVKEFVKKMGNEMGIEVQDVKLCGLFTQKWEGVNPTTLMHYYKANFISGTIKPPSDCTDIKWFSFDEALKTIPYEIMTSMMQQINKNPGKVIGAHFERYKDANNVSKHRTIQDFYVLN
jgi:hypothetical protein